MEAKECKSVDQLNNRTKYDVTHNDIIRLISGSNGDKQYVKEIAGSYGGNSCWSADYSLTVIRGLCDLLQKEDTVNERTDTKSVLIPKSRYCVVVEYKRYSDMNGKSEESETFHFFTVTSGWIEVSTYNKVFVQWYDNLIKIKDPEKYLTDNYTYKIVRY